MSDSESTTGPASGGSVDEQIARHRGRVVAAPIDPVSMSDTVRTIMAWTESDLVHLAVGVNAAVCNLSATDEDFRRMLSGCDLAYADGQSVVWAANALGVPAPERVATTDLVYPLMSSCAAAGKRIYLFGGMPGRAQEAAIRLTEFAPGLITRCHDGYVPEEQMPQLVADINAFGTDVLLIGLGDPKQQEWVRRWRSELTVPAVLTCGGLFDWTSGSRRRAPHWVQRAGLEWAWRLALEPRRLARRYLIGNPAFVLRVLRQYLSTPRRTVPAGS